MKINALFLYNQQQYLRKFPEKNICFKFFPLEKDTISFSGKRCPEEEMKYLPEEAFPSSGLREFMIKELERENADIVSLHREYYSKLNTCNSLEEAKKLYPEFKDVINAKDIDLSSYSEGHTLSKIKKGKFKGLSLDNLSITLLKKYYAELIPDSNKGVKDALGISHSTFHTILDILNIKRDKRYSKLLGLKLQGEAMKVTAKTPEYKERVSNGVKNSYANNPALIEKRRTQKLQHWQNPQLAQKIRSAQIKAMQTEEYKLKRHQLAKKLWQNEDYINMRRIVDFAAHLAWETHPEAKQLYKDMAKEFPDLGRAISKKREHKTLTEREKQIERLFFKSCNEKFPNLKKEIAEIQISILTEWGFYDKDRDINKILDIIEKIKQNS